LYCADHAPHKAEEKETTFDLASFGMIGLESCFGAVNKILIKENKMKIEHLINLLTINPRNIMGFQNDLFSLGAVAEIVVLDTNLEWIFSREHIESKSINSPYIGKTLKGKVVHTISRDFVTNLT